MLGIMPQLNRAQSEHGLIFADFSYFAPCRADFVPIRDRGMLREHQSRAQRWVGHTQIPAAAA
jgi:hypothetical protein